MNKSPQSEYVVPAGTVVKIEGHPFELKHDAVIFGIDPTPFVENQRIRTEESFGSTEAVAAG